MSNVKDIKSQLEVLMKRPEGTVDFTIKVDDLFNMAIKHLIVFEIISGEHIFILERDENLKLNFYHSSPGTGTRVSTINLNEVVPNNEFYFALTWSTSNINLYLGEKGEDKKLHKGDSKVSDKRFRVVRGKILQIGDTNVETKGERIFADGRYILEPTAIDSWNDVVNLIRTLQEGMQEGNFDYNIKLCNLCISALVSGFEIYCKKRCIELDKEGIEPNVQSMINRVFSKYEREHGIVDIISKKAEEKQISLFNEIVQNNINFQSYDECKRAYSKAYEIKFGELGLSSEELEFFKKIIKFRHKIIHVSPLISIMNQEEVPPKEPIFSGYELLNKSVDVFNRFITSLHKKTLELKASN